MICDIRAIYIQTCQYIMVLYNVSGIKPKVTWHDNITAWTGQTTMKNGSSWCD